jgi:hypothetical protein
VSVERAVHNNAEWCDAVCKARGRPTVRDERLWTCDRPPRLYPDIVTLDRSTTVDDVLAVIGRSLPGRSVKDSFASLDLEPAGFRVLFDATWICRQPASGAARDHGSSGWTAVTARDTLAVWREASDAPLPDALLVRADVVILRNDGLSAGGVLNRSDDVVGLSNVFGPPAEVDATWSACVRSAAERFPGLPVVGYERGEALEVASRQGFEPIGPLRVWLHDS